MSAHRGLFLLLSLILTVLLPSQAFAQLGKEIHIAAALVPEGPVAPGDTVDVAVTMTPEKGWHGYWVNPGDAGQETAFYWTLPGGWSAGEPAYPVPGTLMVAGFMNHVYEADYAILVPITVAKDAAPGRAYPVSLDLEWVACSDTICVPQQGSFATSVEVAAVGGKPEQRFDEWRAAIPPLIDSKAQFEIAGGKLRIGIPLPAGLEITAPHLFLRESGVVDYAAPQIFRRTGDWLVAELALKRNTEDPLSALSGILKLDNKGEGVRFAAIAGAVPQGGEVVAAEAGIEPAPLWSLLGLALLGGLLLNIMPCVFPILSLKALSLARAGESEAEARREGLAYTGGVILACLALGGLMLALRAAGNEIGWAFQLQEPGVVVFLLVLAAAITANFAGVFELPSLSVTSDRPLGAFATGLLAAFVATPCTGPFMAAAMGAALLLPTAQALLLFAALGLGIALPFLALGFVPALRRLLPKPGKWMNVFRRILAIPMGLTALALVWLSVRVGGKPFALLALLLVAGVLIALAVAGVLQRRGKLAWPAFGLIAAPFLVFAAFALPAAYDPASAKMDESIHDPVAFDEAVLDDTISSQGKPVFLWFTADWCLTCKVNERVAIEREEVRDAFQKAGVVTMRGDWTQADPAITKFLERHGAAGVPLYLWYEPNKAPEQLPQVLTPAMLVERAARK